MKLKVCAVVVIFNKLYCETETYKSLKRCIEKCPNINIFTIVYDNSSIPQKFSIDNTIYVHDPSNRGVIPAYIYSIDYCKKNHIKWLFRLDQDSFFDEKLIQQFIDRMEIDHDKYSCYIPKIISEGETISPSIVKKGGFYGKMQQSFCGVYPRKISFINSMSFIDVEDPIICNAIYSTEFMLDMSDHDVAYYVPSDKIYILNIIVSHSLSVMSEKYVDEDRYKKILDAECEFAKKHYKDLDNIIFKARLVFRSMKHILRGRLGIAIITVKKIMV